MNRTALVASWTAITLLGTPLGGQTAAATLKQQVFAAESAFAASFARRDTAGFAAPPFSWKPEVIEVAESGNLAWSSGPAYDAEGRHFGNFNSVWRRETDGVWRVVFDKGRPVCDCGPKP